MPQAQHAAIRPAPAIIDDGGPIRIVQTSARTSRPLVQACAALGLSVRRVPASDPARAAPIRAAAARLDAQLRCAQIALILAPSGAGKSTLLRALAARARPSPRAGPHAHAFITAPDPRAWSARPNSNSTPDQRSILELLGQPWPTALATLARAGLADATLIPRRPHELSDGQRARLSLALAMAAAQRATARRTTVLADEFATALDRPAARLLCRAVRRWISGLHGSRIRLIVASAHSDVEAWLAPDVVCKL